MERFGVNRREIVAAVAAGAVAWPFVAISQESRTARIGILVLGNPDPAPFMKEFKAGLNEVGYIEGKNVQFEFRSADKNSANLAVRAAELVALKVDVIVAFQTPAVTAAKHATADIPIVMGSAGDPVGTGLVASLARPGGNITGVTGASAELGGKNLELIHEVLPSVRRVAVLANAPDPFSKTFLVHIQAAAKVLNVEINPVMVRDSDQLAADFAEIVKWQAQALIVQPSLPLKRVADLAIKHRLPSFAPNSGLTAAGGMLSYSADLDALYRQSATFVDKILKGRRPADLPVELPTKYWLVINLKTAKAIGVTVPGIMLTRADEVIE